MRLTWQLFCLLLVAGSALTETPEHHAKRCPPACSCQLTEQGLHKALCFSVTDLYKYSTLNKNYGIDILDLTYTSVRTVDNYLDKFTEVSSLDLSFNEITSIKSLLENSEKLIELRLKNNRLKSFSAASIPSSVRWLDLRTNKLVNVPSHLDKLKHLHEVLLEGNPIHCSCFNLMSLHNLQSINVTVGDVRCAAPAHAKGQIWHESETLQRCKRHNGDEMMFGDQPDASETFPPHLSDERSMKMKKVDLNDDDQNEFIGLSDPKSTVEPEIFEGSGDVEKVSGVHDDGAASMSANYSENDGSGDNDGGFAGRMIQLNESSVDSGEEPDYGSGDDPIEDDNTTTQAPMLPFLDIPFDGFSNGDGNYNDTEILARRPTVFQGVADWNNDKLGSGNGARPTDQNVEENISKTDFVDNLSPIDSATPNLDVRIGEENTTESLQEAKEEMKTSSGTYICIGLIITFLVALIAFTVMKSYARKKRDRRTIRQQRTDVEKAGKEMVDMNKSLLGKPAPSDPEKKVNGNYEMVPTHEKPENGIKNQPKEAPAEGPNGQINVVDGTTNPRPDFKSPIINVTPLKFESDEPPQHAPGTNGYPEPDLLPDSRDYLPLTPPSDSGRVKIKLTETPKPKTPTLVTRSRSNAGDIIITPAIHHTTQNGAT